jgi:hypothetical protein
MNAKQPGQKKKGREWHGGEWLAGRESGQRFGIVVMVAGKGRHHTIIQKKDTQARTKTRQN